MPTGYTYKVCDGTMTSAKEFLLDYVKQYGIGYFVTRQGELRMPKKYSPELAKKAVGDYHTKALKRAKEELEAFNKLSDQALKAKYDAYVAKTQNENDRRTSDNYVRTQRYLNMIDKVRKWAAPSGLEGMKSSAITHLEESKEFDCKLYLDDILTYDEWLGEERKSLVWDVNYHTQKKAKENARRVEMDTLLRAFYESLESVE